METSKPRPPQASVVGESEAKPMDELTTATPRTSESASRLEASICSGAGIYVLPRRRKKAIIGEAVCLSGQMSRI